MRCVNKGDLIIQDNMFLASAYLVRWTWLTRTRFPSVLESREKQGERWGKEQPTEQPWNPCSSPSDLVKPRKSPEPDSMTDDMLIHLGNAALWKLVQFFNHSWEQEVLPQIWREAMMIPILKKGKVPQKANSYRPVSLTRCVIKAKEIIVIERLK